MINKADPSSDDAIWDVLLTFATTEGTTKVSRTWSQDLSPTQEVLEVNLGVSILSFFDDMMHDLVDGLFSDDSQARADPEEAFERSLDPGLPQYLALYQQSALGVMTKVLQKHFAAHGMLEA